VHFFPDALSLLPQQEAEAYALQHSQVEDNMPDIIAQFTSCELEWSMEIARVIISFTARSPYQYSKAFYNSIIHALPVAITNELETFAPPEEYYKTLWKTQSDYITQLATVKAETQKAFNE